MASQGPLEHTFVLKYMQMAVKVLCPPMAVSKKEKRGNGFWMFEGCSFLD